MATGAAPKVMRENWIEETVTYLLNIIQVSGSSGKLTLRDSAGEKMSVEY